MTAKPKLNLVRPSAAHTDSKPSRTASRLDVGEARLVVQVAPDQHRAIKIRAASLGLSIRDYVLGLLERDGAFRDP
jgi:hypothetical protein